MANERQYLNRRNAPVESPDDYFNPRETNKDYFWYAPAAAASISTVTPNVTQSIQVDSDADFFWVATSYQVAIAGAAITESSNPIPLVTLSIVDTGSGKFLMNNPVALGTIAGDGKRPYRLIRPRVFAANATINLNWTNQVAAGTTYTLFFTLHGYKRYVR